MTHDLHVTGMAYIGDLFQLPPVKGGPVYKHNPNSNVSDKDINGEEIWFTALNSVILLDKNFRQQDKTFLEICRAIRFGRVTQHHLDAMNERIITKDNMPPPDALYIYPFNKQVLAVNIIMTHRYAQENKIPVIRLLADVCPSPDDVHHATAGSHGTRALIRDDSHDVFSGFTLGKSSTDNDREGLLSILDLHLGAPLILCNVSNDLQVKYNIANNSTGKLIGFWPPSSNQNLEGPKNVKLIDDNTNGTVYYPAAGHEVTHLLIQMNNPNGKSFQMPGLPPNVYALARKKTTTAVRCQDGRKHVVAQFPVRLFYSSTGDKVQGASLIRPVVLGAVNNNRTNFMYVVITRVLRLVPQLYLARKLTMHDMSFCGPDALLEAEMERLEGIEQQTIRRIETCPRIAGM